MGRVSRLTVIDFGDAAEDVLGVVGTVGVIDDGVATVGFDAVLVDEPHSRMEARNLVFALRARHIQVLLTDQGLQFHGYLKIVAGVSANRSVGRIIFLWS